MNLPTSPPARGCKNFRTTGLANPAPLRHRRASHRLPINTDRCTDDARVAQLVEQRIENPRVGGSNPSPGTIASQSTEKSAKSSSRRSKNSVCYTNVLHNGEANSLVTVENHYTNEVRSCYTKVLHKRRFGLVLRGRIFYVRKRVPSDLRPALGRTEIWKSLNTDSWKIAVRRLHSASAQIEADFERLREGCNQIIDATLISPLRDDTPQRTLRTPSQKDEVPAINFTDAGPKLGEAYQAYLNDPTRSWASTTCQSYETTGSFAVSLLGSVNRPGIAGGPNS